MEIAFLSVILILAIWMVILYLRIEALKRSLHLLTGYLSAILNNENLISESLTTVALYYGIDVNDLTKMLERKKNESK